MKTSYWIVLAVVIVLGIMIFHSIKVKEKGNRNFEIFYGSRLDGKIQDIQISVGVVYLKLSNSDRVYSFIPITGDLNKNTPFYSAAKKGDYILKPSKSDTLKLIKDEETYMYTFQKL